MKNKLTPKQEELYIAIKDYIDRNKYSPSIRELCIRLGNSSPATVHAKLRLLKEKEFITYEEGKNRTIRIKEEY